MRQWLRDNKPIDGEDLERHDKWLCMMWPRLQLLHELLADDGAIFVSIDDHEQWRLLGLLQEVFGENNFIATLTFVHHLGALPGKWLTTVTEYIHVFAKDSDLVRFNRLPTDEDPAAEWESDDIGYYKEGYNLMKGGSGASRQDRPNLFFPIYVGPDHSVSISRQSPDDVELLPIRTDGSDGRWRWSREKIESSPSEILVKPHRSNVFQLIAKQRPNIGDTFATKPRTLWYKPRYQSSQGTNTIRALFDGQTIFDYPKAVGLVVDLLKFANVGPDDIVLDSFAGSGTTAHAVLALNKEDGGNRKFILVECEDYADNITAERVRRVIKGVSNARDATLREGLGNGFTYCTLGKPITMQGMLNGQNLPEYSSLASYLLHCATGMSVNPNKLATNSHTQNDDTGFFYESDHVRYHLLYEQDIEWLCDDKGALNYERAKIISEYAKDTGKSAVVFAPMRYMSQSDLTSMHITFCQLPYELTASRAQALEA